MAVDHNFKIELFIRLNISFGLYRATEETVEPLEVMAIRLVSYCYMAELKITLKTVPFSCRQNNICYQQISVKQMLIDIAEYQEELDIPFRLLVGQSMHVFNVKPLTLLKFSEKKL